MAEISSSFSELPESDSDNLKESLNTKQLLLQKVYSELDEEREASSTAANEAMSMILRLQGEKAQLKMEASQYKREAEEKMCLAEESLAIFEDLLYQKEMEIAGLEYQVQAYRYKLSELGCSDVDIPEYKFPDSLPQQRNDSFLSEIGVIRSSVRRHDSLPTLVSRDSFPKRSSVERDRSPFLMPDSSPKIEIDQEMTFSLDMERKTGNSAGGDINTYWERIRKLDEQMKEISEGKINRRHYVASSRNRLRSCSVPPPLLDDSSLSSSPTSNLVGNKTAASSSNVQDMVQNTESWKSRGLKDIEQKNSNAEGEKRYRKAGSEENADSHFKNKVPPCPKVKDKPYKQREKTNNAAAEYQAEIERLSQRLWRLENKENNASPEISVEGDAGAMMLKEILGQLNTLQSEVRKYKTKKSNHLDEQYLHFLREAMVYFWM